MHLSPISNTARSPIAILEIDSVFYWIGENKLDGSSFQSINCYTSTVGFHQCLTLPKIRFQEGESRREANIAGEKRTWFNGRSKASFWLCRIAEISVRNGSWSGRKLSIMRRRRLMLCGCISTAATMERLRLVLRRHRVSVGLILICREIKIFLGYGLRRWYYWKTYLQLCVL